MADVILVALVVLMALAVFGCGIYLFIEARKLAAAERSALRVKMNQVNEAMGKEDERLSQERAMVLKHHVEAVAAMTSYGRYELDAGERALKMQQIIDQRVKERTLAVKVDKAGRVLVDRTETPEVGEQPPDPNVRASSIVDEIHEYERDLARVTNEDYDYEKRDTGYQEQPLMEA